MLTAPPCKADSAPLRRYHSTALRLPLIAPLAVSLAFGAVALPSPAIAQAPGPGDSPVPRDDVPPIITPGSRNDPRRPRGVRSDLDNEEILRTQGSKPGVIDTTSGGSKGFQAGEGGTEGPGELPPGVDDSEAKVEEVIEWKTNFEQGIKCKKIPLDAKIRLDFNEISLGDLTKFISCVTEQNFLLTGGVNRSATVSILSPKPVTAYEAYKAYLSALEANGLTIIPNGKFLEIVASGEARSKGGPIFGVGAAGPNTDQMVTRLIQLDHIPAEEILPVIEKFKTGAADITIYGPTNTMIITDTGSNIRRLLKLVADLDVPIGKERIWIRPVVNASAAEIAGLLGQIIGEGGAAAAPGGTGRNRNRQSAAAARAATVKPPAPGASPGMPDAGGSSVVGAAADLTNIQVTKMIADERTNSLIFVATRTAYLQVDKIVRKLDVAIPGEGSIHIHPLENADAEEIAQTLSALTGGRSGTASSRRTTGAAPPPGQPGAAGPTGAPTSTVGEMFSGDVKITAYKPKNSLVIESTLKDYLSLQKVIRQLDVRRKQVYVEAIVMEIAQNKDRSIGFSGSGGTTFDVDGETIPLLFGAGGLAADLQGIADTLGKGGGAAGLIGPPVDIPAGGVSGGTVSVSLIGFTLKALQTTTNVNVLSTPHILTLENEEAEIQVGKRRPYSTLGAGGGLGNLTGLLGGLGGLGGTTGTGGLGNIGGLGGLGGLGLGLGGLGGLGGVQYVDIDLTLKIKPTVNASDFVRMEIQQSIDDIDGLGVGDAPITSKRKVTNVVEVKDGQAVVIGGLIRDQESESVSKVPFLGDIPLIGLLFRKTTKTVEKRNLIMIIIPHVIKDPSDLKRLHEKRMEEYRAFARTMAEREKEYAGELDYRKKSGILHDVHKTVEKARAERDLRERTLYDATDIDPVGPPETHDIEYDPRDALKDPSERAPQQPRRDGRGGR